MISNQTNFIAALSILNFELFKCKKYLKTMTSLTSLIQYCLPTGVNPQMMMKTF